MLKKLMLKMLKILCILLKVLVLVRTDLTFFLKDQEDPITQDISYFKIIDVLDYMLPDVDVSIQYYFENETVRNEVVLHEKNMSSPERIPSEPTFPRAYVEFGDTLNKKDIFVIFRWNEPKFTNEVIQKYSIQYWFIENRIIQRSVAIISNITILQYKVYDLKPDTMYYFKVQAHNEFGAGFYTNVINVSTTYENPVPLLLVKASRRFYVLDTDLQIGFERNINTKYEYAEIVYSALEHKIYAVTYNLELITLNFNPNAIEINHNYTKIARIKNDVYNFFFDWIRGSLYWINQYEIMKIDLTLWQQGINTYNKIAHYLQLDDVSFIGALPYKRYLYWTEFPLIMQSDFDGKHKLYMETNKCFCLNAFLRQVENYFSMMIDTSNIDNPLMYWLINNCLIVTDINGCNCNIILRLGNQTTDIYLTIDSVNIYLVSDGDNVMYILKKKYAFLESKENTFERVQKIYLQNNFTNHTIIALDKTLQLHPPKICIIPINDYRVKVETISASSIVVSLPEPILNDGCEKYNLVFLYNISVSYLKCSDNDSNKFEYFNVLTYKRHYEFHNLMSFTEYTFKLALSNFYIHKLSMDLKFGPDVKLTTTGKLNAPNIVTVHIPMPTLAIVYWMPPKKLDCVAISYEMHWSQYSNDTQETLHLLHVKINKLERTTNDKFFTIIQSLITKQRYKIYVRVYPISYTNIIADSLPKTIYMPEPNNLYLSGRSINSMNISWIPSMNLTIHKQFRFILEYKNDAMREWKSASTTDNETVYDKITYYIENLLPQTLYKFRLSFRHRDYKENYTWPSNGKEFTFKTLDDTRNDYGFVGLSESSEYIDLTNSIEISAMQYNLPLISSLIVIIIICTVCYFYCTFRQYKESNEIVLSSIMPNMELTILNEIPSERSQLNLLYSPNLQYKQDKFTLIKKNQIILSKLLGRGAFGKVFQGIVKDFQGSDTMNVAIKIIRENASSQEKKQFIQEAKLMSDLCHRNVLKLLGICLNADSPMLVLELMEAGDLLKYLKDSRKLEPSDSNALRLQDLLAVCEDIARGCCYLEKQHFVHRDLACRNCLISSRNRENRIVKIGDFGLARDIYKHDYYRMKGETPLPVRWMAPETLTDRIYTSQSDVWAFGVLMWEITSLGQQPYFAINDFEVCQYVCAGNKLSKPVNCPQSLYKLMLSCWNEVTERPKFKYCLENIGNLRDRSEDTILISMNISRHVETNDFVGSIANNTSEHLIVSDASSFVTEFLT